MPRRHIDAAESLRQDEPGEREIEAVLHRLLGHLPFDLCAFCPADSGPHCDQVTVDHGFRSERDDPSKREDVSVDFADGVEQPADERHVSVHPRTRLQRPCATDDDEVPRKDLTAFERIGSSNDHSAVSQTGGVGGPGNSQGEKQNERNGDLEGFHLRTPWNEKRMMLNDPRMESRPAPASNPRTTRTAPAAAGVGRLEAMARVTSPASRAQIHQRNPCCRTSAKSTGREAAACQATSTASDEAAIEVPPNSSQAWRLSRRPASAASRAAQRPANPGCGPSINPVRRSDSRCDHRARSTLQVGQSGRCRRSSSCSAEVRGASASTSRSNRSWFIAPLPPPPPFLPQILLL